MAIQTNIDKLSFLLQHARRDLNLCVAAYQIIEKSCVKERPFLLETIIREYKRHAPEDESIKIPEMFTEEKRMAYTRRYQRIVDGHLEEFLNMGLEKEEFYSELTQYIMTDKNLLDDGARAFAIYDCCIDRRLPYACVDLSSGLQMDNDKYSEYIDQLRDEIERIDYIMNAKLIQGTERASLLLQELRACKDNTKKTVLLSVALRHYEVDSLNKALSYTARLMQDPQLAGSLFSDD